MGALTKNKNNIRILKNQDTNGNGKHIKTIQPDSNPDVYSSKIRNFNEGEMIHLRNLPKKRLLRIIDDGLLNIEGEPVTPDNFIFDYTDYWSLIQRSIEIELYQKYGINIPVGTLFEDNADSKVVCFNQLTVSDTGKLLNSMLTEAGIDIPDIFVSDSKLKNILKNNELKLSFSNPNKVDAAEFNIDSQKTKLNSSQKKELQKLELMLQIFINGKLALYYNFVERDKNKFKPLTPDSLAETLKKHVEGFYGNEGFPTINKYGELGVKFPTIKHCFKIKDLDLLRESLSGK